MLDSAHKNYSSSNLKWEANKQERKKTINLMFIISAVIVSSLSLSFSPHSFSARVIVFKFLSTFTKNKHVSQKMWLR